MLSEGLWYDTDLLIDYIYHYLLQLEGQTFGIVYISYC